MPRSRSSSASRRSRFYIEGYHRPSYRDPDDAVYDAISDIMSNGRVSRLYRSLVEQQQIAAEAEGFSPFPGEKYPSLFAFYAVPLPGHTPAEMREAIHKEIEKLKTTDVTDAELEMYKTRTRADLLRGLDDNQGLADSLAAYQTRYGDWRELFLQLDKVDKVTKADIRRVANQVFVASNRTSAEIDTEAAAGNRETEWRRAMKNGSIGHIHGSAPGPVLATWEQQPQFRSPLLALLLRLRSTPSKPSPGSRSPFRRCTTSSRSSPNGSSSRTGLWCSCRRTTICRSSPGRC